VEGRGGGQVRIGKEDGFAGGVVAWVGLGGLEGLGSTDCRGGGETAYQ
jgi:hypothetical protein